METRQMSAKRALELIDISNRSKFNVGEKWYLVAQKWWAKFHCKATNALSTNHIKLSSISNESIVEKSDRGFELKPKLVEKIDFIPVPELVFNELRSAFGVENDSRDVIHRKVIKGVLLDQQVTIEYYPIEIKIARFADRDKIVTLKVSNSHTLEEVRTKAMETLNIPEKLRPTAQFLVKQRSYQYEPIWCNVSKMNDAFRTNAIIYIDEAGKNEEKQLKCVEEEEEPKGVNFVRGSSQGQNALQGRLYEPQKKITKESKNIEVNSGNNTPLLLEKKLKRVEEDETKGVNFVRGSSQNQNALQGGLYEPQKKVTKESKNIEVNSGNNNPLDISRTLVLIREGNITEAESLITSSTLRPFYESDRELVLALKLQAFVEFYKKRDESDEREDAKMFALGKFVTRFAVETQKLDEKLKGKVEDMHHLAFFGRNQVPEKYVYLLSNDARSKLANLIERAFKAFQATNEMNAAKKF